MSDDVTILPMGPRRYAVTVREGAEVTHHEVTVPEDLPFDLGQPDVDEELLVRESFAFLLEREKATAILRSFSLDEIGRFFPEYLDELRTRVA